MSQKISMGILSFDDLSREEAVAAITLAAEQKAGGFAVTPNSTIAHKALTDPTFAALLGKAMLTLPDGAGVTAAARLLQTPFTHGRMPGVELGEKVAEKAAEKGLSLFLFGGRAGVAESAAEALLRRYPALLIAGTEQGYGQTADGVAEKISASGADIVFCCLGSPMQEIMADKLASKLARPVLCLGGSLDVYAGNKRRAPLFFRRIGCEWLWRTLSEPKRIARLPSLFAFVWDVVALKRKKRLAIPDAKGYNGKRT